MPYIVFVPAGIITKTPLVKGGLSMNCDSLALLSELDGDRKIIQRAVTTLHNLIFNPRIELGIS